ncbi:MAG: cation:proton antiporter [Candidatus Cloacimonetes bacterium]|nr:cation:proton antiporter [Candidatus Cloacimonadota bacterium]
MTLKFTALIDWIHHERALLEEVNILFVLAVILIIGFIFSRLARKVKLPSVTMQIIGGIIIGPHLLNLFNPVIYESFKPITNFALGFIGLAIGSHLDFRKLHNSGKRIFLITFCDAMVTSMLVFSALYWLAGLSLVSSLIIAAISITTAPGSTINIVKEKRAKGILTKTLLASVALNNVLVIVLFYSIYYYLFAHSSNADFSLIKTILNPLLFFLESLIVGGVVGYTVIYFTEKHKTKLSFLTVVVLAVIITVGASETLHFSGILSSLILGIMLTNYSRNKSDLFGAFTDIEKEVFSLFFVLAGTHFDFHAILLAGSAGGILVISRFMGKYLGPTMGAYLSGSIKSIKDNIGFTMFPIAGLAIGLVMLSANIPFLSPYASEITAIILTAVVVYELLGPVFAGNALKKAGEVDKDRVRLLEFLQEEYIMLDLKSSDKWETLDALAEFLYRTHKCLHYITIEELKTSVRTREKEISTGIGNNIAIPHAIIEGGPRIMGVIGISQKGIDFDSIDELPVHIIIMIATPEDSYSLHLNVLAHVARIFGHERHINERLLAAKTPAEVFEILQSEEVERLNPFFEE